MWVNLAAPSHPLQQGRDPSSVPAVTADAAVNLTTSHPDGIAGTGSWPSPQPRRGTVQLPWAEDLLPAGRCSFPGVFLEVSELYSSRCARSSQEKFRQH